MTDVRNMRKLMEAVQLNEEGWRHERERLKADAKSKEYSALQVNVKIDGDEVTITHGHGENIFLSYAEWEDFANMITQNRLKGGM